ncbi:MAG TPA: lysylphosphatidylglycerol synthase transmembrane domain-containing protein [Gaiellaceae bacterium]|nr:lysylphosphatidylglycerol synthase transmembrane domain-containing protein [Gaiellaceae bacterium]
MRDLFDAIETFVETLTTIHWTFLGLAVLCHLGRIASRSRAWRNVIAAAYPNTVVDWRHVFGGYVAGVGTNALVPGRGGDLVRLYIVKHRVEGSTYPTLGSTLLADGIFDLVAASALLIWALTAGVLPGGDVLPTLPAIDWLWVFKNPWQSVVIAGFFLAVALVVFGLAYGRITEFWQRVRQGLAILRTPRRYLREVALWDAADWALRLTAVFFFLHAFGLPATAYNVFAYQVAGSLSTALPLTPAGIGTEQALLVFVFSGVASASKILAFSVGVKLVTITVNVTLGLAALLVMLGSVKWRDRVEADAAERA